jgi:hypothetical protein
MNTAFPYGNLQEEIFMDQLEGFSTDLNLVCQLHKSIYEIKKASQVWNATINTFLLT